MGTSAGPSLAGIGRGGASNLVLEMDAHDAKSYAGEPTTNTLLNGYFPGTDTTTVTAGWINISSTAIRAFRPAEEDFFYKNLGLSNPRVVQWKGGGWYSDGGYMGLQMPNPTPGFSTSTATTVSFWYRFTGQNAAQLSNQYIWFDFDYGLANLAAINYTDYNDTEWHFHSATQTSSGSYAYYNLYIYAAPYSSCPGGSYFEIGALQIEQKGYATPFVGEGQFARPTSVNLMIHGGVGTGTSFEDSSPSKHTITTNGNTTHSAAQSKFSGGSIYFDGTGDSLAATSTDFAFGTNDFTADCWLYKNATVAWETMFDTYSVAGSNGFLCGLYDSTGQMSFYSENGHGWHYSAGPVVGLNAWYHLAWVRDGNNLRTFVNGVQCTNVLTLTSSDNYTSPSLILGGRQSAQFINGYMDEMRITKGTALWTKDFTPPTRRNLSAPVVDRSGNDNGGNFATKETTDVTNYRVGEVIRPIANAVWDFDGTDDKISIKTDAFDLKCFTIAIKQERSTGYYPGATAQVNVGVAIGSNGYNGIIMGSWTGTMANETLSWWGYGSTNPSGSSATYIKDEIAVGWHIFTFNWNGSDYDIWVDGTKRITYARQGGPPISGHSGLLSGVTAIYPGWSSGWTTNYFMGQMGFFRAYDKSLSDQQIIENFHAKRNSLNIANWSNRDIVKSGLMRWLDFGDTECYAGGAIGVGSGMSSVKDLNTGTEYGILNTGGGITYGPEGGGCFDFAGTTDDKIPFTWTEDLPACTVSVWVYNISGGDTRQTLLGHYFEIATERLQMYSYNFTALGWRFSTVGSVPYNTWTNAVMTWDGTNVKAYINGAHNYTNTVGAGGDAGGFYEISVTWARLKAKLATALIYDRALSASELEQNFTVQRQRFGV